MKVALVHDWLTGMRGGEKCLEAVCELFPDAPVYTLVHHPGTVSPIIERRPIHTSFVQRLPGAARHHQRYLPLFPAAVERFDLRGYDLVISLSHCVAKAVRTAPGTTHVCFCFTPMRYVWEMYDAYWGPDVAGPLTRAVMPALAAGLRRWDVSTVPRVHHFLTDCENVRRRIRTTYERDSEVIGMWIDTAIFHPAPRDLSREDEDAYDLVLAALVPYKRIDLAVEAARRTGRRLVVIGSGVERARLERHAGPRTEFVGWASPETVVRYMQQARCLVFPGDEDFGLVPLEAIACGTPVVAFARGGALETVRDGVTGVFFQEQSADALIAALTRVDGVRIDAALAHRESAQYTKAAFQSRFQASLRRCVPGYEPSPGAAMGGAA